EGARGSNPLRSTQLEAPVGISRPGLRRFVPRWPYRGDELGGASRAPDRRGRAVRGLGHRQGVGAEVRYERAGARSYRVRGAVTRGSSQRFGVAAALLVEAVVAEGLAGLVAAGGVQGYGLRLLGAGLQHHADAAGGAGVGLQGGQDA